MECRCGSAAFGGWLADKYDYTYSFLITAILQSIGILIWSTLLPLVPRREGQTTEEDGDGGRTGAGEAATSATGPRDENADDFEDVHSPMHVESTRLALQEPLLPSED